MKIMMLNSLYPPDSIGGAEHTTSLLTQGLTENGHEVTVVRVGPEDRSYVHNGVEVRVLHHRNAYWVHDGRRRGAPLRLLWKLVDMKNFPMTMALMMLFHQYKPDVVHSHCISGFSTDFMAAARRMGIPVVHTLREYYLLCARSLMVHGGKRMSRQALKCKLYTWNKKRDADRISAVCSVSRATLDKHLREGYFSKVPVKRVIYNPCPLPETLPEMKDHGRPLRFAYLGRLVPSKGIGEMVDAFRSIRGAELHFFGSSDPGYLESLRKRASGPGNIVFHPYTDREEIYRDHCDILLFPANWDEPLSNTVQEARARGKYIVTTPFGGIPEALEGYDKVQWLEGCRTDEIRTRCAALLERRHAVFAPSEKRVKPSMATKAYVEAYEEVYREVTHGEKA